MAPYSAITGKPGTGDRTSTPPHGGSKSVASESQAKLVSFGVTVGTRKV
jgi:hypothetical protein